MVTVMDMATLQVLSVAVYNHYKRIYHGSMNKGLVFAYLPLVFLHLFHVY